jgi:glycosyltransferase involved in cell wall biosynthesis
MRILIVAPTPFFSDRGTHIRILEEAVALEKLGHNITISTYHIGEDISRYIETKIDVRRILRLLFWYNKKEAGPDWQKIILDLMLIRKTFFLARVKKVDIIHGHLHEGVLIGWIVQKLLFWRKIKLVSDFHGTLTGEMLSHGYLRFSGLKKVFSFFEKFINRRGDFAVTSSWELEEEIRKNRTDGKVATLQDGVNLSSFKLSKSKEKLKKDWEIPENKLVIGYTGGLVKNKGIYYFLEAIPQLLEKRKDIFFLIGGFPEEHVRKFIKETKLSQKEIRLITPLDYFKLPEFLACCDVSVDPKESDTKQASGKMLNYMAAGLPVVCFDKINNRKYLGEGGIYVKDNSPSGIANGILFFLENEEIRKKSGEINRERAQSYSWDNSGKKLDTIYNNLLKNK